MTDHLPPYPDDHSPRAQEQPRTHQAPTPALTRRPQPAAPLHTPAGRSSIDAVRAYADAQTRALAHVRTDADTALVSRVLTLRYLADMADYGPDAVLSALMDALTITADAAQD